MRWMRAISAVAGGMLAAAAPVVMAQAYPAKPVRMIAASSPGSAVDIVARIVAQKLGEQLGQQVIVDNRAGAGGNLGAELAAKAAPDGYTLFMGTPAHAINTGLYRKLNYDLVRDFAPVSQVTSGQYVIVVHPSLPVKSVRELIALARAKPGQLNYASAGSGNATHLAGELFSSAARVKLVHVPYKGSGPALTDLVGGQVQLMFSNLTAALPQVKSGRIRALAVTGQTRAAAAPDLPTVIEAGVPGYVVTIVVRRAGAGGDSARTRQPAQCGSGAHDGRTRHPRTAGGRRRRTDGGHARAVCRFHQERNRAVDQGDQGRRHRRRVIRVPSTGLTQYPR